MRIVYPDEMPLRKNVLQPLKNSLGILNYCLKNILTDSNEYCFVCSTNFWSLNKWLESNYETKNCSLLPGLSISYFLNVMKYKRFFGEKQTPIEA